MSIDQEQTGFIAKYFEKVDVEKINMLSTLDLKRMQEICVDYRGFDEEEWTKQIKMLQKYCYNGRDGIVECKYNYSKGSTFGRLFCNHSIQGIHRDIRGYLMKHTTDLDMENAHPRILLYLCTKYMRPSEYKGLKYYVENRKAVLEEVQRDLNMTRDEAKVLFLEALNKDWMNKKVNCSVFNKIDAEKVKIQKKLCNLDEFKFVEASMDKDDTFNRLGSYINKIMCYYENMILQVVIEYLKSQDIVISTLMFDGLMMEGNYYNNDLLLREIEKVVEAKFPGLNMKFSYKQHSTVINESMFQNVVNQRFLSSNLFNGDVVIESQMGTGKSVASIEHLKKYVDNRVLFITNKIFQAYDISNKISTVQYQSKIWHYKSKIPIEEEHKWIICQPESMFRIQFVKFDVVVCDEVVSVLEQFVSSTQKERAVGNFMVLQEKLQQCKQLIAMDADASGEHVEILKCLTGRDIKFIRNTFKNTSKESTVFIVKNMFFNQMERTIKDGKRFSFCSSSITMIETVKQFLLLNGVQSNNILIYTSKETDRTNDFISGVNNVWNKYDYVLYTSKVPNGISFDVEHFHCAFSYLGPNSISVRELSQMEDRVRKLKDNEMFHYIKPSKNNYPVSIEGIKAAYESRYINLLLCMKSELENVKAIDNDIKHIDKLIESASSYDSLRSIVGLLRQIYYLKMSQVYRTRNNPLKEYLAYKRYKQGRTCREYVSTLSALELKEFNEKFKRVFSIIKSDITESMINDWNNSKSLSSERLETVTSLITSGKATAEDKLDVKKSYSEIYIGSPIEPSLAQVYNKNEQAIKCRYYYDNQQSSTSVEAIIDDSCCLEQYDFNFKAHKQMISIIKDLVHKVSPITTESELVDLRYDFDYAYSVFNEKLQREPNKKQSNPAIFMRDKVNKLLNKYCFELKSNREGKGESMIYTFNLQDCSFLTKLTDSKYKIVKLPVSRGES